MKVKNGTHALFLVERLNIFNWCFQIWPRLFFKSGVLIYVIDAPLWLLKGVRFLGVLFKFQAAQLQFRLSEVKDEAGQLLRLRIPYQDLLEIQKEILANPIFKILYRLKKDNDRWLTYLDKSIHGSELQTEHILLSKAVFLIQLSLWQASKEKITSRPSVFLNRRPWPKSLIHYGDKWGVKVFLVWPGFSLNVRHLPWCWLKRFYYYLLYLRWCLQHKCWPRGARPLTPTPDPTPGKLAVEYYGCFNLDNPAVYSDFFFWQQSELSTQNLSAFFRIGGDPLDEKKLASLQAKGIEAVVLDPRASRLAQAPPYFPSMKEMKPAQLRSSLQNISLHGLEKKWLKGILFNYEWWYHCWTEIFKRYRTKIYVCWYKYDGVHCALGAALRDLGGLLAVYQRALDLTPFIETQLHADLYFASSAMVAEVERKVNSKIAYFVVTGYLGDHRFPLLKGQAEKVRRQLCASGASYILAFTDEGSADDPRWHVGHPFMRVNYAFLLEKLLQNPWMGLVLKPKVPKTLRQRLGEIVPLLEKALKTGRCFLYEEGPIQGTYPPAVAALSADLAIHGHLCGPTAALEAALVGTPTLLLDREGWPVSPLYQLGEGKVVFKDWETLWAACLDHQRNHAKDHPLGSWGPMLDQLDPFRDGKAAYRMGTYLQWLIEGLNRGETREDVLTQAAQRYQKIWGGDKIVSI